MCLNLGTLQRNRSKSYDWGSFKMWMLYLFFTPKFNFGRLVQIITVHYFQPVKLYKLKHPFGCEIKQVSITMQYTQCNNISLTVSFWVIKYSDYVSVAIKGVGRMRCVMCCWSPVSCAAHIMSSTRRARSEKGAQLAFG